MTETEGEPLLQDPTGESTTPMDELANSKCATLYVKGSWSNMNVKSGHLLFAATWLVHRPVSVRMCDMLNSEFGNQPENLCIKYLIAGVFI